MTTSINHLICVECSPQKITELLDQTSWAKDFSWPQISVFGQYFKLYSIGAGSALFQEGDSGESMGIVVKGSIDIFKQHKLIAQLKPGRTYGEMSLIDNQPRSATAIAVENSDLLVIDRTMFIQLAENNPKLAFKLLWKIAAFLSQNLRKTSGHLIDFL